MTGPSRDKGLVYPGLNDDGGMELWFREPAGLGRASSLGVKIKTVLTRFRSDFQEIAVVETVGYGRMLILDGIIQLTEFDESGYHEMIAHVPLISHPDPARVLVIGGGDGGTVREILKHPEVQRVVLCEIDPEVVRVCREYFPGLSRDLNDPRVEVVYLDGAELAARETGAFEVVIVDSSDPVGPAEVLFKRPFFESLAAATTGQGIVVTQAENLFYHPAVIAGLFQFIPDLFPVAAYYQTQVPTYPGGAIGFTFCSKGPHPWREADPGRISRLTGLEYYSASVHRSAFALPARAAKILPESVLRHQA